MSDVFLYKVVNMCNFQLFFSIFPFSTGFFRDMIGKKEEIFPWND